MSNFLKKGIRKSLSNYKVKDKFKGGELKTVEISKDSMSSIATMSQEEVNKYLKFFLDNDIIEKI